MIFTIDFIRRVLREEDIEGLINIHGAPADEYDSEADALYENLQSRDRISEKDLMQMTLDLWGRYFNLDPDELALREANIRRAVQRLLAAA